MAFFTDDQIAILSAGVVRVAPLVELQFDSGTMRLWNGYHAIVSGGETWLPMKESGQIEGLSLVSDGAATKVTFTLSGIPDSDIDILAKALEETPDVQQRTVLVYLQLFDDAWQPSGSPIAIWWGVMQPPKISQSAMEGPTGAQRTITLDALNAFFNRSRPPLGRYTDRDQQKRSDGDTFFQFTPNLLFKSFTWPDY